MYAESKYNIGLKRIKSVMEFVWSIYMLPSEINNVQKHCTPIL